jgi:hypothetical protein
VQDKLTKEPLAGVTVVAVSPHCAQGSTTAITDEMGAYMLSDLSVADDYIVTFYYADVSAQVRPLIVRSSRPAYLFQLLQQTPDLVWPDLRGPECVGSSAICSRVSLRPVHPM